MALDLVFGRLKKPTNPREAVQPSYIGLRWSALQVIACGLREEGRRQLGETKEAEGVLAAVRPFVEEEDDPTERGTRTVLKFWRTSGGPIALSKLQGFKLNSHASQTELKHDILKSCVRKTWGWVLCGLVGQMECHNFG